MLLTVAELADHFRVSREAVAKWTTRGVTIDGHRCWLRPVDVGAHRARLYDLADAARFDAAARRTLAETPYHRGRGRPLVDQTPTR
ncbi:hypothetical protein [Nocardiopsis aegyptia]|uniref:Uncharacterized protein n=1 Tax=Nocardiopsis aegyptia TaxID=220378 RepID=A0A7Z0ELG3_9ACTN|nr:hypothetical protein [Nocardiopsis aegyptia]NYJ33445.1 hypothetical protein [Nocardiopsis aegyptia]